MLYSHTLIHIFMDLTTLSMTSISNF